MDKVKCEIDGLEFSNGGVLARYLKKKYSLTYKSYYHRYILKSDDIPKCGCGCGEETRWNGMGYSKYKPSHHIRIKNPWGHNPTALQKSIETRRKNWKAGKYTPWCKGLSTKTDIRLKTYGEKISNTINSNPQELKRRSEFMSQQRQNGNLPTLYGPASSQWKGGVSEVNNIARNDKRLYDDWKYPILIRDGFKCTECDSTNNLHIHHDKETMSEIVKKHIVDEEPKEFELKKSIAEKVVNYHITNKVSGITLCNECHNKYHPSLNFL
jgi:hypothetical protein